MIYIGFSTRTHKLYARILCKRFKHCAPIVIQKNSCLIYQFVRKNKIEIIPLTRRDLHILNKYGWRFVKYETKNISSVFISDKSWNCVQFTKNFCNIKNMFIQTPDSLYKHITQK